MTATYPPDRNAYDRGTQDKILRIIADRCPRLRGTATDSLRQADPVARQLQLDRLIPTALRDATANWTSQDRVELVAAMRGSGQSPRARTKQMQVRVSTAEHDAIAAAAHHAGMTVSQYVRWRALDIPQPQAPLGDWVARQREVQ